MTDAAMTTGACGCTQHFSFVTRALGAGASAGAPVSVTLSSVAFVNMLVVEVGGGGGGEQQ